MSDGDALLAAILAQTDEEVPRLAYADWLDEHGGAAARDRAEFVRAQVALARLAPVEAVPWSARAVALRAREKALLAARGGEWLEPLKGRGGPLDGPAHGQFRRGFVEVVWMPATWFPVRAARLFARAPVRELRVTHTSLDELLEVLRSEYFTRLNALDLSDRRLGDDLAHALAVRPVCAGLRALSLSGCGLTDAGADALAHARFDWALRELDVRHNALTDHGARLLRARFGAEAVRAGG
ncbi:MAG: TIGR02996 domain-containing protein [Planctomycetes bacterium]|nr:TIGR02996 domain-containing protein [Planctomycetota bacterium]